MTNSAINRLRISFLQLEVASSKDLHSYGKSPCFLMGKSTISMAISISYVSLPEGNHLWKTGAPRIVGHLEGIPPKDFWVHTWPLGPLGLRHFRGFQLWNPLKLHGANLFFAWLVHDFAFSLVRQVFYCTMLVSSGVNFTGGYGYGFKITPKICDSISGWWLS
jgi:hypothetical protein